MTRRVIRLLFICVISLLAFLAACSGGGGGPSVRLLLEADLSDPPAGFQHDPLMDSIVANLERRASAFDIGDVEVRREGEQRLSVTLRGPISLESARRLMTERGRFELGQPVLDEEGNIVCETPDGTQFSISSDQVRYSEGAARTLPFCPGDGDSGEILWRPAFALEDVPEEVGEPTLEPDGAFVDRTESPLVVVQFSPEATAILQVITEALEGFPLGLFVDEELLVAPTVREPVTTGQLVIPELSIEEARILAATLTVGALPVPLREISSEAES